MTPKVRFDVPEMFRLSGPDGMPSDMHGLLVKHQGTAPNLRIIQNWKARGSIPAYWQAAVLYALMKEGHRAMAVMQLV